MYRELERQHDKWLEPPEPEYEKLPDSITVNVAFPVIFEFSPEDYPNLVRDYYSGDINYVEFVTQVVAMERNHLKEAVDTDCWEIDW